VVNHSHLSPKSSLFPFDSELPDGFKADLSRNGSPGESSLFDVTIVGRDLNALVGSSNADDGIAAGLAYRESRAV